MSEPIILEGEATPPSLEKWLTDYGHNHEDRLNEPMAQKAVDEGYFFDLQQNFTDKGLDLIEANGVLLRTLNIITLGRQISAVDGEGNKFNIQPGSQVVSLFAGTDRKTRLEWDDIMVGDQFPILRLYRSKSDTRAEHRWPSTWPMNSRYIAT